MLPTAHACVLTTLQGIIHNTRLALSAVGQQQDVDVAAKRYAEEWFELKQLVARCEFLM